MPRSTTLFRACSATWPTTNCQAATKKSEDDVDIRFAQAAAEVAKVDYEAGEDANNKVPGTVTQSEVLRRLLDWHKMELSIEKAKKDQVVARLEAKMAEAELHAAEANIERRQIVAPSWFDRAGHPLDAVVVELTQHVGQWVQIGEPVMRLVRMDRLRVNGVLNASEYRPSEIQDRPVEIAVTPAAARSADVPGQVRVRQAGHRGRPIFRCGPKWKTANRTASGF